jgi:hypothetical protein
MIPMSDELGGSPDRWQLTFYRNHRIQSSKPSCGNQNLKTQLEFDFKPAFYAGSGASILNPFSHTVFHETKTTSTRRNNDQAKTCSNLCQGEY